ncbi:Endonuclease/exonuclease/phosphatase [Trichoderma barbatum]
MSGLPRARLLRQASQSDTIFCTARPKIVDGAISRPTRTQLQSIKKLGFEAFKKKHPLTILKNKRETTPSPVDRAREEPAANYDDPPQAPAEAMAIDLTSPERASEETEGNAADGLDEEMEETRNGSGHPPDWRKDPDDDEEEDEEEEEEEARIILPSPLRPEQSHQGRPVTDPMEDDIDGAYHDTALSLAWEGGFDIVLIQEPWTKWDAADKRRLTKNHPGYQAFNPINDWRETRPSVLTYTKISANLPSKQLTPIGLENGCICWVSVCGYTVVNVYRRAADDISTDILKKWGKPPPKSIIAGDFNAKHWSWQPGVQPDTPGRLYAEWAEETDIAPILIGSPTRASGYTIDLVFTNCLAVARVEPPLNTGSDHFTVTTCLPDPERGTPGAGKLYVPIDALENFEELIKQQSWTLPTVDLRDTTPEKLDKTAAALQELLADTIKATGRKRH